MKQKIISYLSTEKDDLYKLCNYLYENPEDSYKEHKSCEYISNFLSQRGFDVEKNFLGIDNSFIAKKGSGHPKICYLCEYDAIKNEGHITGHNLLTTISVTASIALGKIIDNFQGTVILIGCPGEYLGGTKSTMAHQKVFDDIDIVMEAHPDIVTCESGTSSAIIPLKVSFLGNNGLKFLNENNYSSLDAILCYFSLINSLSKGLPKDVNIDSILSKGGNTPSLVPLESEAKFYIRSNEMDTAKIIEEKLRNCANYITELMGIQNSVSLYEPPSEELLTNITLNRLFSHNLKENGIIDICDPRNIIAGLSLGSVSHIAPSIHPYISIVEPNSTIKYGTKDFAKHTLSEYAQEQGLKAALSLAFTGLDLIENENLLAEVKSEFFSENKNHIY
ncbi:amidohydrolase [Clostridium fallax]|uniref:Peptidase M20 domain-containing protein 2 n=1 Tax=Clostridium fallax TaxID=1533 RepID=A0A1M4TLL9_9CLOT|nr:amidohydrolase [Clostridium fallax]SHE45360.1 amidohydrolase [Clostridium fallax]SQB22505.1 amidohydrolase [Clostridium fallax]